MSLHEDIAVTAELTGTNLSEAAAEVMAVELAAYPREQVIRALSRCRKELKTRLTMAAVIERLDDGRPGAEEAWAILPRSESQTAVWTEEMALAFGVASPLLHAGDPIAARMAFKETYSRLVAEARNERKPVNWTATLGHDPHGREGALAEAVAKGRLSLEHAREFIPGLPAPRGAPVVAAIGS